MAITAAMVKELREKTGSGMMDCKKALEQTGGDMEAAIDELRKKGLATAQKRAGRIAAEGLTAVIVSEDSKTAGVVEVNSETDFVANNDLFRSFVKEVADQALIADTSDIDTFMNSKWHLDETKTVNDALVDKISVIRENLKIRRVQMLKSDCYVGSYVHGGGRISVLVAAKSDVVNDEFKEAVKNVAMQVCSMKPEYKSEADIPQEVLDHERAILMEQAASEGKPQAILAKMVEGRLKKEMKELCLMDQLFFRDQEISVAKYLDQVSKNIGSKIEIESYIRFETGEGIEKKQENFAEEVAKQMQG